MQREEGCALTEGDPIAGCTRWNGTSEVWALPRLIVFPATPLPTIAAHRLVWDLPLSSGCGNMMFSDHGDVPGIVRVIREGAEVDYQAFLSLSIETREFSLRRRGR